MGNDDFLRDHHEVGPHRHKMIYPRINIGTDDRAREAMTQGGTR